MFGKLKVKNLDLPLDYYEQKPFNWLKLAQK